MAASTEDIVLKILSALKAEQDRTGTLLQCRPYDDILREVAERHAFAADDVRLADRYLKSNDLIRGAPRQDGFAALPSPEGIAHLDSHKASAKKRRSLASKPVRDGTRFLSAFSASSWHYSAFGHVRTSPFITPDPQCRLTRRCSQPAGRRSSRLFEIACLLNLTCPACSNRLLAVWLRAR